jgi:hypothetical protein
MFRKQNSGHFSPKSLDCLPDGSGGHIRIDRTVARPVGQSPTATNAHDPVTSERGGPSPYRVIIESRVISPVSVQENCDLK